MQSHSNLIVVFLIILLHSLIKKKHQNKINFP